MKIPNLVVASAASRVSYCPCGFFSRFVGVFAQNVNQHRKNVSVDDGLNLLAVSRRDVAHRPAGLFSHVVSQSTYEFSQIRQNSAVDDYLGLGVVPRHDVSDGSERGRHDTDFGETETRSRSIITGSLVEKKKSNIGTRFTRAIRLVGDKFPFRWRLESFRWVHRTSTKSPSRHRWERPSRCGIEDEIKLGDLQHKFECVFKILQQTGESIENANLETLCRSRAAGFFLCKDSIGPRLRSSSSSTWWIYSTIWKMNKVNRRDKDVFGWECEKEAHCNSGGRIPAFKTQSRQ